MYEDLRLPYDRSWKQQQGPSQPSSLRLDGKGISSDGMFDQLVRLEEEDGEDEETQSDNPWSGGYFEGPVDTRKVPEYPLLLLETDQTVPWFKAVGKT